MYRLWRRPRRRRPWRGRRRRRSGASCIPRSIVRTRSRAWLVTRTSLRLVVRWTHIGSWRILWRSRWRRRWTRHVHLRWHCRTIRRPRDHTRPSMCASASQHSYVGISHDCVIYVVTRGTQKLDKADGMPIGITCSHGGHVAREMLERHRPIQVIRASFKHIGSKTRRAPMNRRMPYVHLRHDKAQERGQ